MTHNKCGGGGGENLEPITWFSGTFATPMLKFKLIQLQSLHFYVD